MTAVTFKNLFIEYQASGLSVHDFCANQDIAPSTFYYWKKKLAKQNDTFTEFVPLPAGGFPLRNARCREQDLSFQDRSVEGGS